MKHGIIVAYKPKGPTSHDTVDEVRKKLKTRKVGHAGTLDPFACGVLIIGINQGTRVLEFYKDLNKVYWVKMRLGLITETFDITGEVVEERECKVSEEEIREAIFSFVGEYEQVPPAYSAKKYKGERLYKLARDGKIISLPPRKVRIFKIWDVKISGKEVSFRVEVSSGTYVRSLCMDIGYKLGCGATAVELVRERVGHHNLEESINVFEATPEELESKIIPLEKTLEWFASVVVYQKFASGVLNGSQIFLEMLKEWDEFRKDDVVKVFDEEGNLLALAMAERNSSFLYTLKRQRRNERVLKLIKVFNMR
ncbi:tRNA pseudouridine(55) synthase TruB [Thermotoga sp. KOL6]|uniref:tRNA pseudouridine(55) synthase TruB n=1 Tax=Thermotoga sp. KOL6 TaxID=126741 RepID=UPI000C7839EB|nr:tRNA pseudouridine(55) synthase TruB [Thermotoga sp. KOL6]PLV58337.1 tRNA pseudouridine synthase B [Thermotoga sp. KOL6]